MSAAMQIKVLTALLCLFNIASLFRLDFKTASAFDWAWKLAVTAAAFAIYYFFFKAKNWARILIVIGAAAHLLWLPFALATDGAFAKLLIVLECLFDAYLMIYLTLPAADDFFLPPPEGAPAAPRSKTWAIISAVALCLILLLDAGVYVGLNFFLNRIKDAGVWIEDSTSGEASKVTKDGMNSPGSFSRDGRKLLYYHLPEGEMPEFRIRDLETGSDVLAYADENRNWDPSWCGGDDLIVFGTKRDGPEDLYAYSISGKSVRRLTSDDLEEDDPVCSPDGRWVMFVQKGGGDEALHIVPSEGGGKRRIYGGGSLLSQPRYPAWSADSRELGFIRLTTLMVVDLKGAVRSEISLTGLSNFTAVFFDPRDPDTIIVKARKAGSTTLSSSLYRVSRRNGSVTEWRTGRPLMEMHYRVSPDGSKIAYSKHGG